MRKKSKKQNKKLYFLFPVLAFLLAFFATLYLKDRYVLNAVYSVRQFEKDNVAHTKFLVKVAPYIQETEAKTGIMSSITLAQAALESNWGQSQLSSKYNNYFGVKTSSTDASSSIVLPTKEYVDGKWITVNATFARYSDFKTSIDKHSELFTKGTDWNPNQYIDVTTAKNYVDAANGLVKDGYATDPDYATKLIKLIEKYDLNIYDK